MSLASTVRQHIALGNDIEFTFSKCKRLKPSAVAVLGGLARLAVAQGRGVAFAWETCNDWLKLFLQRNGFATAFGWPTTMTVGQTVPYREDTAGREDEIVGYLRTSWLGRGWVKVSDRLRQAILATVWEIYANAFDHGQSAVAVVTCGHHYTNTKSLSLSVVDFGIGIPANVREHFKNVAHIPADMALRWAFRRGATTKPGARGMGLDLLKDFVRVNDGQLLIYSGDGVVSMDKTAESFSISEIPFVGTIVTITLKCDDRYYRFASEAPSKLPLF